MAGLVNATEGSDFETSQVNKPAVGVVVDGYDCDELARVVLRAQQHDHSVIVAFPRSAERRYEYLDEMDSVFRVSSANEQPRTESCAQLQNIARALGFPGMLCHKRAEEVIDYERSLEALNDTNNYSVDTISKPRETRRDGSGLLVAIPAYNEETNVDTVVREARESVDNVLIIDDGSDDDTAERARRAGGLVVEHGNNRGYGAALKTAFREAKRWNAEYLVVLDADRQHNPADIPRLIDRARELDSDLLIGSRFAGEATVQAPLYRRFGLSVINMMTNIGLGLGRSGSRVQDTQSGFRVYSRRAVRTLATDETIGDRMSASTDILYHAHQQDYQIDEIGVQIEYNENTENSHDPLSHGMMLVTNLVETIENDRPMLLLGTPGFVSIFTGLGVAYWLFWQFSHTGTFVGWFALLSAFLILVGFLACFKAIVLQSLNLQRKQGRYR